MTLSCLSRSAIVMLTRLSSVVLFLASSSVLSASPSREAVVGWLRHQEDLVTSMECEYEDRRLPTDAAMIPRIREFCRKNNKEDSLSYLYSEELARRFGKRFHWWRKGSKERSEVIDLSASGPLPANAYHNVEAYDGRLIRTIGGASSDKPSAGIFTLQSLHWDATNRVQPFSFLYEFETTPYSDVVARSPIFESALVRKDGDELIEVRVRDPKLSIRPIVLWFDRQHRLIERAVYYKWEYDPKPRIFERHVFLDYQGHADPSGETIWFPRKAVYHYYMGVDPQGLIEYNVRTLDVKNVKFNIDIPDDRFDLEFPPGVRVWDGVHGLGMLGEGVDPEDPHARRTGPVPMIVAGIAVAVLTVVILVLNRRRRPVEP